MKINKRQQEAVTRFDTFARRLAQMLPAKTQPFFLSLLLGALLAIARRRTITQWLKAAQISDDFRQAFYHMPNIGRKGRAIFDSHRKLICEQLKHDIMASSTIRLVLDDSPTKRYGKKIEGAGYHHNPTPGRTNAKTCFGHSWVVAVLVVSHSLFGEISFPIDAELYLRQKEIDKLKEKYDRPFKTKTTLVVEMVKRLVPEFARYEKKIEIIVDGGYAKETVLLPLATLNGVITITRLRRDAVLFEIPPTPTARGRGRPRVYGNRVDVKSMIASNHGWRYVECWQYGQVVKKRVKWFVATSKLTRGKPIKVVLVKEGDGTWVPLVSTDANQEVKAILESYGVRFGIEEAFKDLKETWGWGKQELRLLESNEAATVMNMVLYGLTELATWRCKQEELVDRRFCPWDDAGRRPSHADRRNFLRRNLLAQEFNVALNSQSTAAKLKNAFKRLLLLAT